MPSKTDPTATPPDAKQPTPPIPPPAGPPPEEPARRGPGRPRKPVFHEEAIPEATREAASKVDAAKKIKRPYPKGKVDAGPFTVWLMAKYRGAQQQLRAMSATGPLSEIYDDKLIDGFYSPACARMEEYFKWEGIIPDVITLLPPTVGAVMINRAYSSATVICGGCHAQLGKGEAHKPDCLLPREPAPAAQ